MQKVQRAKKILYAGSTSKYGYTYQNWYFALKNICDKLIFFDPHWNTICFREKAMNQKFLELIKKEKPDLIFILGGLVEFSFDTLLNIRKISPKTKVIVAFGDEDIFFESLYIYLGLFFDYIITGEKKYLNSYRKKGIKNVRYMTGINTRSFRPLNLEKKYDVTFIGHPTPEKSGRYEVIKFLKEKNIDISLFGRAWENYPDLKGIYKGVLTNEELVKVINQSKIVLGLSRSSYGKLQIKGKIFETSACKAFTLTEYYSEYSKFFKEGREMIMFKDMKDLLNKIEYYLKNEKERQAIAEAGYKKVIESYNFDIELGKIISEIIQEKKAPPHQSLPKIDGKIITLTKSDLKKSRRVIKEKIKDHSYLKFSVGVHQDFRYRDYIQAYSLQKLKKPISCCNYTISNKHMKDYLVSDIGKAYRRLPPKAFSSILNQNHLMVTKEFFLKNLHKFKNLQNNGKIDFLTSKNTVFVFSPLVGFNKIPAKNYQTIEKSYIPKFIHQLYSLKYRRKLAFRYLSSFFLEIVKGNFFLLKKLVDTIKDKDRKNMLARYEGEAKV
jgi:spore maturation protein CgeB